MLLLLTISACGGGGGGDGDADSAINMSAGGYNPTAGGFPALSQVPANNQQINSCATVLGNQPGELIGTVLYERRPMAARSGLLGSIELLPARGVVVEALAASNGACSEQVLATTLADGNGEYAFQLADDREVCVRARAQLFRQGAAGSSSWDLQVTDNTRNNAPYYLLDNNPSTIAARPVRELIASSGWDGSEYSAPRDAGPFAILDSACEVVDELVNPVDGLERGVGMPALKIRWSVDNTPVDGDLSLGEIDTAFFRRTMGVNELFLRGDSQVNSDEYDPHVIVHEMAHYTSSAFLRSDSLGGKHSLSNLLDLTTAFEEGWANAFAGIVLEGTMTNGNEVLFRDSLGVNGFSAGGFYLDSRASYEVEPGWYSEGSIHRVLYDLYDANNAYIDRVTLPLSSIYQALKKHTDTNALTSIFSFSQALLDANLISGPDLSRLLLTENINGTGEYAVSETNSGDNPDALPIYTAFTDGQSQNLCSNNFAGSVNRVGNYRYLQFTANMSREYFFTLQPVGSSAESDGVVAMDILNKGDFVESPAIAFNSGDSLSVSYDLAKGEYVIALSHYDNIIPDGDDPGRKCFSITVN